MRGIERWLGAAGLALTVLLPLAAQANDAFLRAVAIPASACHPDNEQSSAVGTSKLLADGAFAQGGTGTVTMGLGCPLPASSVKLSGSGPKAMSKFRVYYSDSDGFAGGGLIELTLYKMRLQDNPIGDPKVVCVWDSNRFGNLNKGTAQMKTFPCSFNLEPATLYYFRIHLQAGPGQRVRFIGLDFP